MDRLENHITTLEQKIDRLYAVVEHLSNRLDENLNEETANNHSSQNQMLNEESPDDNRNRGFSAMMGHKDVLLDDETNTSRNTASDGEEVSPEIQIRRLNTQLAAAYNRIAALEEQLLAQRINF
jgi:predicted nuclease with TOPRIM domain